MWPPESVKRFRTPSCFRARASRCPPWRGLSIGRGRIVRDRAIPVKRPRGLRVMPAGRAAEPDALGLQAEGSPPAALGAGPDLVARRWNHPLGTSLASQCPEVPAQDQAVLDFGPLDRLGHGLFLPSGFLDV